MFRGVLKGVKERDLGGAIARLTLTHEGEGTDPSRRSGPSVRDGHLMAKNAEMKGSRGGEGGLVLKALLVKLWS